MANNVYAVVYDLSAEISKDKAVDLFKIPL